jgi:hypothetical protein
LTPKNLSPRASNAELLAQAVPDATPREIEQALKNLQTSHDNGEIRTIRGYLKTLIANGDAPGLIDQARTELARPGFRTGDCKAGDHDFCQHGSCTCQCHTKETP